MTEMLRDLLPLMTAEELAAVRECAAIWTSFRARIAQRAAVPLTDEESCDLADELLDAEPALASPRSSLHPKLLDGDSGEGAL